MEWYLILVPAVLVASIVAIDSRIIGPYFALSSLVAGHEGPAARFLINKPALRFALIRRAIYPAMAGFTMSWFDVDLLGSTLIGTLAAFLLLWPLAFGELPWFVPRRTWHLPVLYSSFVLSYAATAGLGNLLFGLISVLGHGSAAHWLVDQFVSLILFSGIATVTMAAYRHARSSTEGEMERRERAREEGLDEPSL